MVLEFSWYFRFAWYLSDTCLTFQICSDGARPNLPDSVHRLHNCGQCGHPRLCASHSRQIIVKHLTLNNLTTIMIVVKLLWGNPPRGQIIVIKRWTSIATSMLISHCWLCSWLKMLNRKTDHNDLNCDFKIILKILARLFLVKRKVIQIARSASAKELFHKYRNRQRCRGKPAVH